MGLSISHRESRFVNTLGATALTYAFVAGQVGDILTTLVFAQATGETGTRAFPHLYEGNPLMRPLVEAGQWWDVLALKAIVTVGIAGVILRMARSTRMTYRVGAVIAGLGVTAATWDIVLNNLRLMGAL
jgi:hypothetical protein